MHHTSLEQAIVEGAHREKNMRHNPREKSIHFVLGEFKAFSAFSRETYQAPPKKPTGSKWPAGVRWP